MVDGVPVRSFRRAISLVVVRVAGIAVAAMACGCSTTFFSAPDKPVSLEAGPADYQNLVARNLATLKAQASTGSFEISPPRKTRLAQPGDWVVCVKTTIKERPAYFAVFIDDGKVLERRVAVVIDECQQQPYQPLPGS